MFEAGALPGMWALLAHFYSKQRLTMPLGWLMGALIVSQALGAPIAAGLMALNGKGDLRGWQWCGQRRGRGGGCCRRACAAGCACRPASSFKASPASA
jgi:MFS family permease